MTNYNAYNVQKAMASRDDLVELGRTLHTQAVQQVLLLIWGAVRRMFALRGRIASESGHERVQSA